MDQDNRPKGIRRALRLIGESGPAKGKRYTLEGETTTVGRTGCSIDLDDDIRSPACVLIARDGGLYVERHSKDRLAVPGVCEVAGEARLFKDARLVVGRSVLRLEVGVSDSPDSIDLGRPVSVEAAIDSVFRLEVCDPGEGAAAVTDDQQPWETLQVWLFILRGRPSREGEIRYLFATTPVGGVYWLGDLRQLSRALVESGVGIRKEDVPKVVSLYVRGRRPSWVVEEPAISIVDEGPDFLVVEFPSRYDEAGKEERYRTRLRITQSGIIERLDEVLESVRRIY